MQTAQLLCGLLLATVVGGCVSQPAPSAPVPLPALDSASSGATPRLSGVLYPGDTIRVKFLTHPELDQKLPIQPDGRITLPYAGEIDTTAMTVDQLADAIRARASDMLRDPQVVVLLAAPGSYGVYVGGEVHSPGFVQYHEGITPLEAIVQRGGFTDTARIDYVVHLVPRQDQYLATRLDLSNGLQSDNPRMYLGINDVLYVPRNTIGDVNAFMRLYIQSILPIPPGVGVGFKPTE